MREPSDPVMRHMLDYIRRMESVRPDGVHMNQIIMDAAASFPRMTNGELLNRLDSLYNLGFVECRYDGRYEIPEF